MGERHLCIQCGAQAPPTDTNYTLISAKFGWRLSREVRPDGTLLLEWRCPGCWQAHKEAKRIERASNAGGSA